ncbi:hypothetical protein RT41_GL001566 [Lactococcus fujiensis JCM 16395]|uniref:Uncharacterized protein n=2 Tax=Lactococcus fujiensis TaxID=610251 RepID=A0A2A5RKL6_9LACT|nr:hypothetical protein RT41_GL001566 [Lactococcus fujiensis JCM 16395]
MVKFDMNKFIKLGLGFVAAASAAHFIYHGYQDMEDGVMRNLTDAARDYFADENILTVWIFDDPEHDAIFKGGVVVSTKGISVSSDKAISFEIDARTLEITEISEEFL